MKKKETLSRREQKDLDKKLAGLKEFPDDPMALSRVGYLLSKAGRDEEALSYLWRAFENFVKTGQYSMAVMVADELLAVQVNNVEIMHKLAQISDQKDIEIPVMEIYKKYKDFHQVPLFTALGKMEFLQLLKASAYHDLKQDSTLIKEGAKGDDIFLIVDGSVTVTKKVQGKKDLVLGTLEKGDFLGEIAFLSDKRRSATISAETACQLLSWNGQAIRRLNDQYPETTKVLFEAFWVRSINTILSLSPLFSHLDKQKRNEIVTRFELKTFASKENVLSEGEVNPEGALYIIKKGEAAVFSQKSGDFKHPMAVLKPGDIFGEYSTLSNKPCTATVTARSDLEVLTLSRQAFVDIIQQDKEVERILEEIKKERIDESLLQMSYFQLIHELSEGHSAEMGIPDKP